MQRLLLGHDVRDGNHVSREELVAQAAAVTAPVPSPANPREVTFTVTSVVTSKLVVREVTPNADADYLVSKVVIRPQCPEGQERSEGTVTHFAKAPDGTHFPTEGHAASYEPDGRQSGSSAYKIEELRVNVPVPAAKMKLPAIPAGTVVKDRIAELEYPVNAEWERIGPANPYRVLEVTNPVTDSLGVSMAMAITVGIVCVVLAVLACAVFYLARNRAGDESP